MDIEDVTRRILHQRMGRFPDMGPLLQPAGEARFRQEGARVRVAFANIHPGMANDAVARLKRYALTRGISIHWMVVPSRPGEAELPAALTAAGFQVSESLLLMAHEGPLSVSLSSNVDIAPVTTWQAMLDYEHGSREAFFEDPYPSELAILQRARDRWREQEHGWCRYYVARLNNLVVGGCYISLFEEVPTIMGVYTGVAARRQGVATALLAAAIAENLRPGRDICCLFVRHGNPAEQLYRHLGFVPLLDEDTYVFDTP